MSKILDQLLEEIAKKPPGEKINISLENVVLTDGEVEKLAGFLKNNPLNLGTLRLKNCGLDNEGVGAIMDALKTHPRFEVLDLSGNNFGDVGVEKITRALKSGNIEHIDEISLNNNRVGDEGLEALRYTLMGDSSLVNTLNCQGNNAITMKGAKNFINSQKEYYSPKYYSTHPGVEGRTNFHIDVATQSVEENEELAKAVKPLKDYRGVAVTPITGMLAEKKFTKEAGIDDKPQLTSHEIPKKASSGEHNPALQTKDLSLLKRIEEKIAAVELSTNGEISTVWIKKLTNNLNRHLDTQINQASKGKNPITPEEMKKISQDYTMNIEHLRDIDTTLTSTLKALEEEKPKEAVKVLHDYQHNYLSEYYRKEIESKMIKAAASPSGRVSRSIDSAKLIFSTLLSSAIDNLRNVFNPKDSKILNASSLDEQPSELKQQPVWLGNLPPPPDSPPPPPTVAQIPDTMAPGGLEDLPPPPTDLPPLPPVEVKDWTLDDDIENALSGDIEQLNNLSFEEIDSSELEEVVDFSINLDDLDIDLDNLDNTKNSPTPPQVTSSSPDSEATSSSPNPEATSRRHSIFSERKTAEQDIANEETLNPTLRQGPGQS